MLLENRLRDFYADNFPGEYGQLCAHVYQAPRDLRLLPVPKRYQATQVGNYLATHSVSKDGVYRHQALAADLLDEGKNIVISTSTNSGKSRCFMAEAFHTIMLSPQARVLVKYPLKALSADQVREWYAMAQALGFDRSIIGKIDGRVPTDKRMSIVARSRILISTPDVVHSWLMGNLHDFDVSNFLKNRKLTILDEIDAYNAAFGTNELLLLRRMQAQQMKLSGRFGDHRYIGASATLPNPSAFFEELTGLPCEAVTEQDNGAPSEERILAYHSVQKDHQAPALEAMIKNMIRSRPDDLGIVFFDSRRAVEEMSSVINNSFGDEIAVVQKSGQNDDEQNRLDSLIASGKARVVIATSSMEYGVNYNFSWGINAGLPSSKRSLVQRMGRIGRHQPGLFVVVAAPDIFSGNKRFGSFENYLTNTPVETPILYPNNQTLQIAAAFCYRYENSLLKKSGIKLKGPIFPKPLVEWPKGFIAAYEMTANPAERLMGEKRLLIPPKAARPHYFHTLRNAGGQSFSLSERAGNGGGFTNMGRCSLQQAMIEYPPGAIVWHQGHKRRVYAWETHDNVNRIVMGKYNGPNKTIHHRSTAAFINMHASNAVGNAFYQGKEGRDYAFFGLLRGRIVQSINSFVEIAPDGSHYPYAFFDDHELAGASERVQEQTNDYGPKRRMKMPTTGLLMYLPLFRVNEKVKVGKKTKRKLFDLILDEYCDAMRIDRRDVDYTFNNITVRFAKDDRRTDNFIYFHDITPGGLGLTHGLLTDKQHNLREIIKRVSAEINAKEEPGLLRACKLLTKAMSDVEKVDPKAALRSIEPEAQPPAGYMLMVAPGGEALYENNDGSSSRVKVIEPVIISGSIGYNIEKFDRKKAFKKAGFVSYDPRSLAVLSPAYAGEGSSALLKHFVRASQISSDGSDMIAMNKKTGHLLKFSGEKWIDFERE